MATKIKVQAGHVVSVYDDKWRLLLESLGTLNVKRATDVEFDPTTGDWIAIHLETGLEIGRGKNRANVISQEVAWLERRI